MKHNTRTLIFVASLAVGTLVACDGTSKNSGAPGALPQARTDVTPRLNASTYVAHGSLLERQGSFEQAAEQYRKALELTPDLPAARNRLGITLDKLGQHAEAAEVFRAAILRAPTQAHLHNNLGFSLYLDGQYAEAEQAFNRALELNPTFRRAHMNRALVLAKQFRYDEALLDFKLAGSEADAYYNLALMQAEAARYAEAARALEQALVINPDFDEARQQLREVARLTATAEAAAAVIAEAQASDPAPAAAPTAEFAAVADANPLPPPPTADLNAAFYARLEAMLDGTELANLPEGSALDVIDLLARAMTEDTEMSVSE